MRLFLADEKQTESLLPLIPAKYRDKVYIPGNVLLGAATDEGNEEGATAAGVMLLACADKKIVRVEWLYVIPEEQGNEIGTRLLAEAFSYAEDRKAQLEVLIEDVDMEDPYEDPRVAFFITRGFDLTGREEKEWFFPLSELSAAPLMEKAGKMKSVHVAKMAGELSAGVLAKAYPKISGWKTECGIPLVYNSKDKDWSAVWCKHEEIDGAIIMKTYGETVYPTAAFKGGFNALAMATLMARILKEFSERHVDLNKMIYMRADDTKDLLVQALEGTESEIVHSRMLVLAADNKGMLSAGKAVADMEAGAEAAALEDQNFPTEFRVTSVEWYSGVEIEEETQK